MVCSFCVGTRMSTVCDVVCEREGIRMSTVVFDSWLYFAFVLICLVVVGVGWEGNGVF